MATNDTSMDTDDQWGQPMPDWQVGGKPRTSWMLCAHHAGRYWLSDGYMVLLLPESKPGAMMRMVGADAAALCLRDGWWRALDRPGTGSPAGTLRGLVSAAEAGAEPAEWTPWHRDGVQEGVPPARIIMGQGGTAIGLQESYMAMFVHRHQRPEALRLSFRPRGVQGAESGPLLVHHAASGALLGLVMPLVFLPGTLLPAATEPLAGVFDVEMAQYQRPAAAGEEQGA